MSPSNSKTLPTPEDALRRKGWTLRTAAPHLGVHFTHLHRVIRGTRESRSLLARLERLPNRQDVSPEN